MSTGKIVQIIGAVVDVEFPQNIVPKVYNALIVTSTNLTMEVEQQIGGGVVRCIAMGATEGLSRGLEVTDTGAAITVPVGLGSLGALPVAFLVWAIGLSLGGTTGYAINPARDLGPRIMHAILPIKEKASNDWGYSWIPVLGPIIGAALAALLAILLA